MSVKAFWLFVPHHCVTHSQIEREWILWFKRAIIMLVFMLQHSDFSKRIHIHISSQYTKNSESSNGCIAMYTMRFISWWGREWGRDVAIEYNGIFKQPPPPPPPPQQHSCKLLCFKPVRPVAYQNARTIQILFLSQQQKPFFILLYISFNSYFAASLSSSSCSAHEYAYFVIILMYVRFSANVIINIFFAVAVAVYVNIIRLAYNKTSFHISAPNPLSFAFWKYRSTIASTYH